MAGYKRKPYPGAIVYFELLPSIETLENAAAGELFKAILRFGRDRIEPDFSSEALRAIWPLICSRLESDRESYEEKANKRQLANRYAAYKNKREKSGLNAVEYSEWLERIDSIGKEDNE